MSKIKPIIKSNYKIKDIAWIIENFPSNYQEMEYIEPFAKDLSIFLYKEKSEWKEIINIKNENLYILYKCLRNYKYNFYSKIKRTTYSERVFKRELKKTCQNELEIAFNEFVLRKMSRAEKKVNFLNSSNNWNDCLDNLQDFTERIEKVNITNQKGLEIIKAFDSENVFCLCKLPELNIDNTDYHSKLNEQFNRQNGCVMIIGKDTSTFKNIYKDWKCIKNPQSQIRLWINY